MTERRGLGRLPGGGTRWRISLVVTALSVAVLMVVSVFGYWLVEQGQRAQLERDSLQELSVILNQLRSCHLPDLEDGPLPFEISAGDDVLVASPLIAPHTRNGPVLPLSASELVLQEDEKVLSLYLTSVTFGYPDVAGDVDGTTVKATYGDLSVAEVSACQGMVPNDASSIRVVVFLVEYQVREVLDPIKNILWWAVPVAGLVVACAAWWSVGRALAPIDSMRKYMTNVVDVRSAPRVPQPGTGDEIDRLASTVNEALARLELSDRRQREFIADAAHELRSPVASLQSTLEVATIYPDPDSQAESLQAAERQAQRLSRLVEELLLLESLELSTTASEATTELTSILDDTIQQTSVNSTAGITLSTQWPDEAIQVYGDATELSRAVTNLMDNALRYATSSVIVQVQRTQSHTVELSVSNDGPFIDPAERERIFERLVRLDDSRATTSGGTGLGLAIIKRVVERAGGQVIATQIDGLTTFVVTLRAVTTAST